MDKLFNILSYGTGLGFTLYTLYDRVYVSETTTTNIWFKLVLFIAIIFVWRTIHKKIFEVAQIQKGNLLIYTPRFPRARAIYLFGVLIGILYALSDFFNYVEERDIPISYTFKLLTVAWIMALGLKLIAIYFEKRKEQKISIIKEA